MMVEESIQKKNSLKKILFGKINRKLLIIFFGMLILIFFLIAGTYSFQQLQKSDRAIIDASGRNRMLSQRIGYYSEIVARGHEDSKAPLQSSIDLHHISFYALKDGGIAPGISNDRVLSPTISKIIPIILEAEELWVDYKKNAEIIVNEETFINGALNPKVETSLEFLKENNPEMLRRNNEIVKAYTNESERKQKNFNYFLIGFLVFSFLLGGAIWSFSKKISKPLEQLSNASKEFQKKNFKVKVNIKTGDELEDLGKTFNQTAIALNKMNEEHEQLEKAKTEFLSITSHELRSPMTPMRAQLQMLLGEYYGKLNARQRNAMEIVSRNTKRLDNIIVDFLEISRIETARLKFRFVKKNPADIIPRLVKEMEVFMPEKNIKIVTKIEKLPAIEHDKDRLSQILRNLINNAIKFSKPNTTITISASIKNKMIEFSIKDQGIGINPKYQKRIFEPFFQVEQTIYREHQGTGLGLAIVKGIIESQEGHIWLESKVGKGTTFFFTIPLKPVKTVRPIKLLFSSKRDRDTKIKIIFTEVLGPMGAQEFRIFEKKNQLTKNDLALYIDLLIEKNILSEANGEVFKSKILDLFKE